MQCRLVTLVAALGLACLPTANDAGQVQSSSSDGTDGEATAPATASAETASSTSGPGTGSDSGSTTAAGLDDPCLAFPPDDCPIGCSPMPTYAQAGECELDLTHEVTLCVSRGDPFGGGPTTFYAEIDGELRYMVHQQPCAMGPTATPVGFTECSRAPEDPAPCHCLCGSQGCPYEDELLTLEACGLPLPCGEIVANKFDSASTYDLCVLAALRDRIPGAYGSLRNGGLGEDHSRVFFGGGEEAQLVHRQTSDLCFSVLGNAWDPARTCTLKPPEWFDACIADPGQPPDCLRGESWFDDCVEQPPSCP